MNQALQQRQPLFIAFFKKQKPKFPNKNKKIEIIKRIVCDNLNLPEESLYIKNRKDKNATHARYIISYLIRMNNVCGLEDTVLSFRGAAKDHTNAIYGIKKVTKLISYNLKVKGLIKTLEGLIEAEFSQIKEVQ